MTNDPEKTVGGTETEAAYRRGWVQSGDETSRLILELIQSGHSPVEAWRLYTAYQDYVLLPWQRSGDRTQREAPPNFDKYAMQEIVKRGEYNHIGDIGRAKHMTDSDPEKTAEVLLLTYTPLIHDVALKQLSQVLEMTVTTIDGEICSLCDIRIDTEQHQIYGRGHKIKVLGEYK